MKLILLINFINELLNLTEEELRRLQNYLEGLLNLSSREEVESVMNDEYQEHMILPEIDEEKIEEADNAIDEVEKNSGFDEDFSKEDSALAEEETEELNLKLVDQLQGLKSELKDFREELIAQNENLIEGGDKMTAELECQCGGERCMPCPPLEYEETELPNTNGELTVPISCIKVLHHNFFDEYDEENLAAPTPNFTINKLDCCREKALITSQTTGCQYPAIIEKACGCIEYGVKAEIEALGEGEEPALICCENTVCINDLINYCCFTDVGLRESNTGVCCCIGIEIDEVNWTDVTVLKEKLGFKNINTGTDRCLEEIDLANKAAVVFEGTITLVPEEV
ncbi:MAG: hypothetical protein R6V17_03930 [Halanaerobacter sp.]